MNKNIHQQNAERRLRHCKWAEESRSLGTAAALGFLLPILSIALLALAMFGMEFFQ